MPFINVVDCDSTAIHRGFWNGKAMQSRRKDKSLICIYLDFRHPIHITQHEYERIKPLATDEDRKMNLRKFTEPISDFEESVIAISYKVTEKDDIRLAQTFAGCITYLAYGQIMSHSKAKNRKMLDSAVLHRERTEQELRKLGIIDEKYMNTRQFYQLSTRLGELKKACKELLSYEKKRELSALAIDTVMYTADNLLRAAERFKRKRNKEKTTLATCFREVIKLEEIGFEQGFFDGDAERVLAEMKKNGEFEQV